MAFPEFESEFPEEPVDPNIIPAAAPRWSEPKQNSTLTDLMAEMGKRFAHPQTFHLVDSNGKPIPDITAHREKTPSSPTQGDLHNTFRKKQEEEKKAKSEAKKQRIEARNQTLKKVGIGLLVFAVISVLTATGVVLVNNSPKPVPETPRPVPTPTLQTKRAGEDGLSADFGQGAKDIVCRETRQEAEDLARGPYSDQSTIVIAPKDLLSSYYCVDMQPGFVPTPLPPSMPTPLSPDRTLSNAN